MFIELHRLNGAGVQTSFYLSISHITEYHATEHTYYGTDGKEITVSCTAIAAMGSLGVSWIYVSEPIETVKYLLHSRPVINILDQESIRKCIQKLTEVYQNLPATFPVESNKVTEVMSTLTSIIRD